MSVVDFRYVVGVSIDRDLNDAINSDVRTGPFKIYRNIDNKLDLVNYMPNKLQKGEYRSIIMQLYLRVETPMKI
jgi:hypothetical protein